MSAEEIKAMLTKQAEAFEAFKKANDARIEEVAKKGGADAVLVEKVERLNTLLGEQQKTIDALNAKSGRRGGTDGGDPDADAHAKAFGGYLRKGRTDGLEELRQKAISIGVDADGGYAVPDQLETNVLTLERKYSPMREVATVRTVANEHFEQLVAVGNAQSGWVGELAARPETNTPTLVSVGAFFGEIYANPGASQRSLEDVFFDVEKWLTDEIAREFAEQENLAFLNGNGTNKPKGILAYTLSTDADATRAFGSIQKIHTGTSAGLGTAANAGDKLLDLIHSLRRNYRQNARFMMGNVTLSSYRKIKDDTGSYLWQPGIADGPQSTLFGYPVIENDDLAEVGTADAQAVLFGDFARAYLILDRRGIVTLRDPYTAKPKVLFYSTKRVGGGLMDSSAVKVLQLSA
jgi:HK97 family phage major capsid protein